jgi:hypothetical protein
VYIAVEGQDPLDQNIQTVVLITLDEAADLYEELGKIFGPRETVIAPKDVATPMPPFPKIDVPPLKNEPVPGTEKQKTLADFIKEMEERKKSEPYKPFENPRWPTWDPKSPLNPTCFTRWPTLPDGSYDPKFTAAAVVDWTKVNQNNFPASSDHYLTPL